VFVVNLLVRGSIEVRQRALISFKQAIGTAIMDNHGQDATGGLVKSTPSLSEWLRTVQV
jgi:hypothetical protein